MTPADLATQAVALVTTLRAVGCEIESHPTCGFHVYGPADLDLDPELLARLPECGDAIVTILAAEDHLRGAS